MSAVGKTPIYIACGSSDSYALQLTVSLHSALSRIDPQRSVRVCVMDGGISSRNIARIRRALDGVHPNAVVEIIAPPEELLAGLPTTDRYPPAVYLRLLMPAVLPEAVERVLYLDADVLVTEDIAPLYDSDFKGKPLLAVKDPTDGTERGMDRLRQEFPAIKVRPDAGYFNGGVMLINLPEWRRRQVSERVLALIHEHGSRFKHFEQDPMNLVLDGDWGGLSTRWNNIIRKQRRVFADAPDTPGAEGILHFTGVVKPWHWGGLCLREDAYHEAMLATGWHGPAGRLAIALRRVLRTLKVRALRRGERARPQALPQPVPAE